MAVKTVATIISAAVTRLTRRSVRQRCHTIHDQLQTTTAMASFCVPDVGVIENRDGTLRQWQAARPVR
jgi:hypothetical protein